MHRGNPRMPIKTRSCVAILPHKTKTNSLRGISSLRQVWKSVGAPPSRPPLGELTPDRCFPDDRPPAEDPGDWPLGNNTAGNSPGSLRFLRPWCRLSSPLRGRSLYSPILCLSLSPSLVFFRLSPSFVSRGRTWLPRENSRQVSGMAPDAFDFFWGWDVLREDTCIRHIRGETSHSWHSSS